MKKNKKIKQKNKRMILALHESNPNMDNGEIANHVMASEVGSYTKKRKTLLKFIRYNIKPKVTRKTRNDSKCTKTNANKIKKLITKNKNNSLKISTRIISSQMGKSGNFISKTTVNKIIHKNLKFKFFKKRKEQNLTDQHKKQRVENAKYLINKYGLTVKNKNFCWDHFINTDFSAPISIMGTKNVHNDGIWENSRGC